MLLGFTQGRCPQHKSTIWSLLSFLIVTISMQSPYFLNNLSICWSSASTPKIYTPLEDNTRFLHMFRFRVGGEDVPAFPIATLLTSPQGIITNIIQGTCLGSYRNMYVKLKVSRYYCTVNGKRSNHCNCNK